MRLLGRGLDSLERTPFRETRQVTTPRSSTLSRASVATLVDNTSTFNTTTEPPKTSITLSRSGRPKLVQFIGQRKAVEKCSPPSTITLSAKIATDDDCGDDDFGSCVSYDNEYEEESDEEDEDDKIDLAAASAEGWIRTLPNKRVRLGRIPKPILFNFCDWIRCPREKPVAYKKCASIPVSVEPITIVINDFEHSDDYDDSCPEECLSEDYNSDADDDENKIDLAAASAERVDSNPIKQAREARENSETYYIRLLRLDPVSQREIGYQGPVSKAVDDVRVPVFIRGYADVVVGSEL
ncbi:hypothetical protein HDU67_001481 [Dinochytrium kinnereticum]|nr:hypothetical protein HDU67_001481 [Dinochytrium kinnereticum]